jgi:hypothetical protein
MRKTRLELDTLAVVSFDTATLPSDARGTVQAHDIEPTPPEYPCTCEPSDLCKTAYYHCGTGPYTIYSCDYTQNGSCAVTQ